MRGRNFLHNQESFAPKPAQFDHVVMLKFPSHIVTNMSKHSNIGIQACRGEKYLALTWAATTLIFLVSMVEYFIDRSTTPRSTWVET